MTLLQGSKHEPYTQKEIANWLRMLADAVESEGNSELDSLSIYTVDTEPKRIMFEGTTKPTDAVLEKLWDRDRP